MDKLPTIRRIPSDLWMEIAPILGKEKEPGSRGRPPAPFMEGPRWNPVCPEDGMPVESSSEGIWIWFDVPQTFPAMGEGRNVRKDMGEATEEIRRHQVEMVVS
jgi:hypothetical protein